jgi:hypothetical protein
MVFLRADRATTAGRRQVDCGLRPVENRLVIKAASRLGVSDDTVNNRNGVFRFMPRVVWFAGLRYACVRVEGQHSGKGMKPIDMHIWSAGELREFLGRIGSGMERISWWGGVSDLFLDAWYSDRGADNEREWLIRERVSIAVSDGQSHKTGHRMWKDARVWKIDVDGLKDMGFAAVVPPWEAFQQLSMWIGGVLAHPGRPMAEIASDTVRRDKHGFDDRSFRKPKA